MIKIGRAEHFTYALSFITFTYISHNEEYDNHIYQRISIFRSEYGAFWKCVTAGSIYMITQLAKMLFLATVFPVPLDEDDDDPNAEMPFDFLIVRNQF